jgi:ligand-binding SRPBCC domain-containing protein
MTYFICQSEFSVPVESLFDFHEGSDGFQTLVGLQKGVEVIQKPSSLQIGQVAILKVPILPFIKVRWVAEHKEFIKNQLFVDIQTEGPFKKFAHRHIFKSLSDQSSILIDQIEISFYLWPISKWFILPMLKAQFSNRHKATANKLHCKAKLMFCGYSSSIID